MAICLNLKADKHDIFCRVSKFTKARYGIRVATEQPKETSKVPEKHREVA